MALARTCLFLFFLSSFLFFTFADCEVEQDQVVRVRQYSLALDTAKWESTNSDTFQPHPDTIDEFWANVATALNQTYNIEFEGEWQVKENHTIHFYDTLACELYNHGYLFRRQVDGECPHLLLKYRSPDYFLALAQEVEGDDGDCKNDRIYEAITGSFSSLYSHQRRCPFESDEEDRFSTLATITAEYPSFTADSIGSDSDTALVTVELFQASYQMPSFEMSTKEVAFVLSFYYHESSPLRPIAVEFYLELKNRKGEYSGDLTQQAKAVFDLLRTDEFLTDVWFDVSQDQGVAFQIFESTLECTIVASNDQFTPIILNEASSASRVSSFASFVMGLF